MMMALLRKLLGINVTDTSELKRLAAEQRMLSRMARAERTDKIFSTLMAEVKK